MYEERRNYHRHTVCQNGCQTVVKICQCTAQKEIKKVGNASKELGKFKTMEIKLGTDE